MMKTLAELREENRLLKIRRQVQDEMLERNIERRKLESENRSLRYPRTTDAFRRIGSGFKKGFRAVGSGLAEQYDIGVQQRKNEMAKLKAKKFKPKVVTKVVYKTKRKKK